jgi:hypothetical protein
MIIRDVIELNGKPASIQYSDLGFKIRLVGTKVCYDNALDFIENEKHFEETNIPIDII